LLQCLHFIGQEACSPPGPKNYLEGIVFKLAANATPADNTV